jgi:hypothetical protein
LQPVWPVDIDHYEDHYEDHDNDIYLPWNLKSCRDTSKDEIQVQSQTQEVTRGTQIGHQVKGKYTHTHALSYTHSGLGWQLHGLSDSEFVRCLLKQHDAPCHPISLREQIFLSHNQNCSEFMSKAH